MTSFAATTQTQAARSDADRLAATAGIGFSVLEVIKLLLKKTR